MIIRMTMMKTTMIMRLLVLVLLLVLMMIVVVVFGEGYEVIITAITAFLCDGA